MVSLNIYKNSTNKFGRKTAFIIENEIKDQDQSIPKFIGILTQVFCTFGPNLVILAWTGDELSCRQGQNGVTFDFEVKFDLEGQGQSPSKTIGILTKVFYTYGPNLVILAWTGDELSRGQASDYRTDGRTHRQTQATTIPEGQNWPRVKMLLLLGKPTTGEILSPGPIGPMEFLWPASWKLFKGSNIHLAKSEMCLTEKLTNGAVKKFHLSKPIVIILLWQKNNTLFSSGLRNMVGWRKMNMERKWRCHDSWWIRYFNKSIPQSPTPTPTLITFFGYGHFVSELVDALYSL